jgi:hypothetical protein
MPSQSESPAFNSLNDNTSPSHFTTDSQSGSDVNMVLEHYGFSHHGASSVMIGRVRLYLSVLCPVFVRCHYAEYKAV